jgi:hypothetical protein
MNRRAGSPAPAAASEAVIDPATTRPPRTPCGAAAPRQIRGIDPATTHRIGP